MKRSNQGSSIRVENQEPTNIEETPLLEVERNTANFYRNTML